MQYLIEKAQAIDVWFSVRVSMSIAGAEPISRQEMIVEKVGLREYKPGSFEMSRSFEIITSPGVTLDARSVAAEPFAIVFDGGSGR